MHIDVKNYVEEGLEREELTGLLKLLKVRPSQMIRESEELYKENYMHANHTEHEWLEILLQYPKLLKRPIVVYNDKAIIGDPVENIKKILTEYSIANEDKN